jgi:hypothetical protein
MFVPHVVMHHRRKDGRRPTRQQRLVGVLTAVMAALLSAGIGAAFTKRSSADTAFVLVAIVGLAAVLGFTLARVIGRSGRV